jgi:release factor glutamine methyltransferase
MRIVAPPGVFRPRSDSWMLAEHVQAEVLPGSRVLDLCTGSGAVAIAAALGGAGEVTAVDVSRRSVLTVRLNAVLNRVRVRALRGDLFEAVGDERFDIVTANPPYLPGDDVPSRGPSRAWEGGAGGRELIDRIVATAPDHLRPGGSLLMIHSEVCGIDATLAALSGAGLDGAVAATYSGPPGPLLAAREPLLEKEEIALLRGFRMLKPQLSGSH